jgi:hypothetical protein
MEKDKFRSVVTISMLACILIFSALFMGCPQPTSWQQKVEIAQSACPHDVKAAYYHHDPAVPPHDSTVARFDFCKSPPPSILPDGTPSPQPCPVPDDPAICACDSLKCTVCGAKLWQHP